MELILSMGEQLLSPAAPRGTREALSVNPSTMQIVVERMRVGSTPGKRPDLWGLPDTYQVDLDSAGGGPGGTQVVARQAAAIRDVGGMIRPGYNGLLAFDRFRVQSGATVVALYAAAERGDGQVERGLEVFGDLNDERFFSWRRLPVT